MSQWKKRKLRSYLFNSKSQAGDNGSQDRGEKLLHSGSFLHVKPKEFIDKLDVGVLRERHKSILII